MEQFLQTFFAQSSIVIFMGIVIYIQYYKSERNEKEFKAEILRLQNYVLQREKEIASERLDEQKETIEALNEVATALSEHNKLTEYEQHRKKA